MHPMAAIYLLIATVGFLGGAALLFVNIVLIGFANQKFVKYIKHHNKELWAEYKNFYPQTWLKILKFIRQVEKPEDIFIKGICEQIYKLEKVAAAGILAAVFFFFSALIIIIISQQQ
jgi:hypothetical protein